LKSKILCQCKCLFMRLAQWFVLAILLGTFPIIQPGQATQPFQLAQSIWKPFSSKEGRFSVLMPGTPRESQLIWDPVTGYIVYLFTVTREEAEYMVWYLDFEPPTRRLDDDGQSSNFPDMLPNTPEKMTDVLVNAGTDCYSTPSYCRLISEQSIRLGSYPGREISLRLPSGPLVRRRLYLVNRRVYILSVRTTQERFLSKTIEGFMNSFKLLSE
jgi:hypothetical protein